MNHGMTRRVLLRNAVAFSALLPAAGLLMQRAVAQAPALDPSDPTAKALAYVTVSTTAGSTCGNCAQFQGKAGAQTGPCTIFPGKSVAAAGWCKGWVKKAL
jgi:hypothetical protein